jgi:hypothetical protein
MMESYSLQKESKSYRKTHKIQNGGTDGSRPAKNHSCNAAGLIPDLRINILAHLINSRRVTTLPKSLLGSLRSQFFKNVYCWHNRLKQSFEGQDTKNCLEICTLEFIRKIFADPNVQFAVELPRKSPLSPKEGRHIVICLTKRNPYYLNTE